MSNTDTAGPATTIAHALHSLSADRPPVELPIEADLQRIFRIRAAESHRERWSASSLVERMYTARGYGSSSVSADLSAHRKTFVASEHDLAIGTLTIGTDCDEGLTVEGTFSEEVAQFRAAGCRLCEFTKLAVDRTARSPKLLASLFHVAYIFARRIKDLTHLLIEVNPRHVRYYQIMLGFKVIGSHRHNARVNAPAVLLSLDLSYAAQQIAVFGGRPETAAAERSAYPHFFSAHDEDGIVHRLLDSGEDDVARVIDCVLGREAVLPAGEALH